MSRLRTSCSFWVDSALLCRCLALLGALALLSCKAGEAPDAAATLDQSMVEPDLTSPTDDLTMSGADLAAPPRDLLVRAPDLTVPRDLMSTDLRCTANTQHDPFNCGSCGHACPAGNLCCNGACSDPRTDPQNCSFCGHDCGSSGCCGGLCTLLTTVHNCAACGVSCGDGESCCGSGCANVQTDPNNCGRCDHQCDPGFYCVGGVCQNPDAGPAPDLSAGCLGGKSPPAACTRGNDPKSGNPWLVCRADCNSAWITHADPGGGTFAYQSICKQLGYSRADKYGGTCGDQCGYCMGHVTSCKKLGNENYDSGGLCGADCLSVTVHWRCVK